MIVEARTDAARDFERIANDAVSGLISGDLNGALVIRIPNRMSAANASAMVRSIADWVEQTYPEMIES